MVLPSSLKKLAKIIYIDTFLLLLTMFNRLNSEDFAKIKDNFLLSLSLKSSSF